MLRYYLFYIASAIVLGVLIYWPLANIAAEETEAGNSVEFRAQDVLRREAKMVDYFCLSKIPPVSGEATIPRAWEKALQSSIELRENAGEVSGSFPELSEKTKELNRLGAGESVYGKSETRHVVAYRPVQSPDWFIVISKPLNGIRIEARREDNGGHPLRTSVPFALIGALVLTIMARFVIGSGTSAKTG